MIKFSVDLLLQNLSDKNHNKLCFPLGISKPHLNQGYFLILSESVHIKTSCSLTKPFNLCFLDLLSFLNSALV